MIRLCAIARDGRSYDIEVKVKGENFTYTCEPIAPNDKELLEMLKNDSDALNMHTVNNVHKHLQELNKEFPDKQFHCKSTKEGSTLYDLLTRYVLAHAYKDNYGINLFLADYVISQNNSAIQELRL